MADSPTSHAPRPAADVTDAVEVDTVPGLGLPRAALPRHIAIIMDGNGRWAVHRGKPRIFGHQHGAEAVRPIVSECARMGVEVLTLYSFSAENWKRPTEEVEFLMALYERYLGAVREEMVANNVRFVQLGRREGLPEPVLAQLDDTLAATAGATGLTLALALNYSSRAEIADAVRAIAREAARGDLSPDEITEGTISDRLHTAGLADPDLLIRTAGEMRLSNFLLWQISYAELWVTPTLWPDFTVDDLHAALHDYASRQRRFGAVAPHPDASARATDR